MRRGFSLLEVLIALAVLTVGGLGTLQLMDVVSKSSANVSAESEAISIARQLRTEMEMASLLPADVAAPWWAPGPHNAPSGGVIATVGDVDEGAQAGRYNVQYFVQRWEPDGLRGLDITIVVDNSGFIRTTQTETRARLLRPVVISFRKEIQTSVAVITGGALRW